MRRPRSAIRDGVPGREKTGFSVEHYFSFTGLGLMRSEVEERRGRSRIGARPTRVAWGSKTVRLCADSRPRRINRCLARQG
jgi:hypothetical protein